MTTPSHKMDLFKAVPVITDQVLREDKDIEAGYYFHSKKLGEGNECLFKLLYKFASSC